MEAAGAELFGHLTYVIRLNNGVDARSDRAIREPARNLDLFCAKAASFVNVPANCCDDVHGPGDERDQYPPPPDVAEELAAGVAPETVISYHSPPDRLSALPLA